MYDHAGGYCTPSARVGVEVAPPVVAASDQVGEGKQGDRGGQGGGVVVLRRHTSCRVQCRVRFFRPLDAAGDAAAVVVHLRVGLPPALLAREVLPVVSLPIRLLPVASRSYSYSSATEGASGGVDMDVDTDAGIDARLGIKGCRTIYLPALGRALLCAESPGQAGIAGKVEEGEDRQIGQG